MSNKNIINVSLANPRGFCAGVDRAIQIVRLALKKFGPPIYVRHEVVHNKYVIDELKNEGAVFVEEIEEIPRGSHVIFSAHGVSKLIKKKAKKYNLIPIDATCPLVTKVHTEVNQMYDKDYHIVLIGHAGHPEVEGTMGQIEQNSPNASMHLVQTIDDVNKLNISADKKISYVSQTTLSFDDTKNIIDSLKVKFPNIMGPKTSDICYATQNRQDVIKKLVLDHDLIIVVGSPNSSNSNRLVDIALQKGVDAFLIDDMKKFNPDCLKNKKKIGISAGASAPEILVQNLIKKIKEHSEVKLIELDGVKEKVIFKLPRF
ncbi:MAG: 4-hydroxy-3-methylbut-2-enyl diphosphate reductase [Methylophilaceae bacterium]|nr:4-hydroxy-3-methylbut-2-enyl diphosphate reductase [Methylophilaceae bacterium]MBL6727996.1 4-hydroxy-3-methylbut-2-enyl diphosphate reductase [Methylophilaceae bacterium]MBL6791608.1 4-hydroxy-3-methylbut-2-enyl diphosphate reductase [Methylophilaceae bacterium]